MARHERLVVWTAEQRESGRLHPLLIAAVFVVDFLEIHPFQDGNGRLSRVLTTLLLLQAGYAYVPYISLERVIESNKDAYDLALRETQGTIRTSAPQWGPWLAFFLRSLAGGHAVLLSPTSDTSSWTGAAPTTSPAAGARSDRQD